MCIMKLKHLFITTTILLLASITVLIVGVSINKNNSNLHNLNYYVIVSLIMMACIFVVNLLLTIRICKTNPTLDRFVIDYNKIFDSMNLSNAETML